MSSRTYEGVARMLEVIKVKAILVQPVTYHGFDGEVNLPVGTEVTVDPERNIALCGSEHFDVVNTEYKVMYLN